MILRLKLSTATKCNFEPAASSDTFTDQRFLAAMDRIDQLATELRKEAEAADECINSNKIHEVMPCPTNVLSAFDSPFPWLDRAELLPKWTRHGRALLESCGQTDSGSTLSFECRKMIRKVYMQQVREERFNAVAALEAMVESQRKAAVA